MFGLFGGKSALVREPTRVWRNAEKALERVAAEAAAERSVVICHFRSQLEAVDRSLQALGKATRLYTDRIGGSGLNSGIASDGIAVALSSALPAPAPAQGPLLVLVAGHHFLLPEEERIEQWCEGRRAPTRLRYHEGLDAPLLAMFGGSSLAATLERLGMGVDESVEHAMVDRAIRNTQEKGAAKFSGARPADSPEEWLRLNSTAKG